jgi:hypothetical protein
MAYRADKHTCQMRLLMVGDLFPALRKSMNNAASLVSELRPFAFSPYVLQRSMCQAWACCRVAT